MTPRPWPEVRALAEAALGRPVDTRAAFLDSACGDDTGLRADVEAQVVACERAAQSEGFLAEPAAAFVAPLLADPPTPLQAALAGQYDIDREIGRGGMATVHLARDVKHGRRVAVKVLDRTLGAAMSAERFLREIRVTAGLTHPHILPLHDSGESAGVLYYVMPFVDGETLRERLSRGPLASDAALRLVREVASALAYSHAQGVVHRDIKPANILLEHGHAVVADFGIARAVRRAQEAEFAPGGATATLTDAGMALGTPAYMAPEQALGDAAVDHRADLYALGVVAYEALAGVHPFGSRSGPALVTAHLTEAVPPLGERGPPVSPAVAALVMRCLEKDPAARPQSGDEIVAAIDAMSPAATSAGVAQTLRAKSAPALLIGALAVLLALGGAITMLARGDRREAAGARNAATSPPGGTLNDARAADTTRSVAVLPFVNTSGTTSDDYFSDGLTDELAHALSRIPGLKLAGRTSSYAFKGKSASEQEIGRALHVGAIITGTVRRSGDRLRVTAQLVSTANGKVVLDSVYERRATEVLAVQDELTRTIVAALGPALGGRLAIGDTASGASLVRFRRGTSSQEAYDLYLKGRYYWLQRGAPNLVRSVDYFRQAIAIDSSFARAYAGLAMAYSVLPNYAPDPADSLPELMRRAAEHAIALDSTIADAHLVLAAALELKLRFREAIVHHRIAIALEPSNATAHHWLGLSLVNLGYTDEGVTELQRAVQADPLMLSPSSALSTALLFARRYREAEEAARHVLTLDSTFMYAIYTLGLAQALDGKPDSAVITMERGTRFHPDDARQFGALLFAYAAAGRWADAQRVREQLHRPGADQFDGIQPGFADLVFGDREPLVRVLASRAGLTRYQKYGGVIGCDPRFDPLWSDARFRDAMHRVGIEPCPLARPWPLPRRPAP